MAMTTPVAAGLPSGQPILLPGRGTTFARLVPGPPGAAAVLLLHGWTVTSDINWGPSYEALSERFAVLALDHRGHGRGIHSGRAFTLEDCADDAVALACQAGHERLIMVGYSMGGPVAQLAWRRHPEVVSGLVLCSTAAHFPGDRAFYSGLRGLARVTRITPPALRRPLTRAFARRRFAGMSIEDWCAEQLAPSDAVALLQAGAALGDYDCRQWIPEVDVPTAVVITTRDRVVEPARQRALAEAIPGAAIFEVPGDHGVCLVSPELFVPVLVEACGSVASRAAGR